MFVLLKPVNQTLISTLAYTNHTLHDQHTLSLQSALD